MLGMRTLCIYESWNKSSHWLHEESQLGDEIDNIEDKEKRLKATVFDDMVGFLIKYSKTYCVSGFIQHESNFQYIASPKDHKSFK